MYANNVGSGLGMQIIGCHIADAAIIANIANAILIEGCRLDTYFKYVDGAKNSFIGNNVRMSYLYGNSLYDVPADTLATLNRNIGDGSDTLVNL